MRFQPVTWISSMLPCNIVGAGVIDVQNSDTPSLEICKLHFYVLQPSWWRFAISSRRQSMRSNTIVVSKFRYQLLLISDSDTPSGEHIQVEGDKDEYIHWNNTAPCPNRTPVEVTDQTHRIAHITRGPKKTIPLPLVQSNITTRIHQPQDPWIYNPTSRGYCL